jgi:threonine synthase
VTTPQDAADRPPLPIRLVCAGCGHVVPDDIAFIARCPAARDGDDVDHVLRRSIDPSRLAFPHADADTPTFVRYRALSRAYQVARAGGWSDERYVELVGRLDAAVCAVDDRGFRETPFEPAAALAAQMRLAAGDVLVKDETRNVAGSHKARHLMGVMIDLLVAEELAPSGAPGRLAIASCGNAALAAAVVARAADRPLDVYVPTWADPVVVERLRELGAEVVACPRATGETGDPTVRRLREAIAAGAVPFTCQGDLNGLAIEGGQTLGYEMVARLARETRASRPDGMARLDAVVVQVGGGALASAVAAALADARALGILEREPRLYAVQAAGCAPLVRAWHRFKERAAATGPEAALAHARTHRAAYMQAWETEPASAAHGILDDETYDWAAVVEAMERTGGGAIAVGEALVLEANELARASTGIDADHTGTAGLAGLLSLTRGGLVRAGETVAVLFTGVRRDDGRASPSVVAAATSRPLEQIER